MSSVSKTIRSVCHMCVTVVGHTVNRRVSWQQCPHCPSVYNTRRSNCPSLFRVTLSPAGRQSGQHAALHWPLEAVWPLRDVRSLPPIWPISVSVTWPGGQSSICHEVRLGQQKGFWREGVDLWTHSWPTDDLHTGRLLSIGGTALSWCLSHRPVSHRQCLCHHSRHHTDNTSQLTPCRSWCRQDQV